MAANEREIPLFPLRAVLFPGAAIPMNVFEQRYRTMMDEVLAGDSTFGIVLIRVGHEVGGPAVPVDVGTLARVEGLQRRPDGTMTFRAVGVQRFRIRELLRDRPFLRGRVELLEEDASPIRQELPGQVLEAFFAYLEAASGLTGGWLHEWCQAADAPTLSYVVAFYMRAMPQLKQGLLEQDSHQKRLEEELTLLKHETELLRQAPQSRGMERPFNLN